MHILTTHVGSLVRPGELRTFLDRRLAGEQLDEDAFAACLRDSVADVVRRQAEAGIDIVSDGEFGKRLSWSSYVNLRLSGIEHHPDEARSGAAAPPSTDARLFPEFWAEYSGTQNFDTEGMTGWVATGPIAYAGQDELRRDIDNLTAARDDVGPKGAFLPVVAPASVWGIGWEGGHYASEEDFMVAVAEALREEYRTIVDAGLYLQVDDAFLPWMYDLMVPPASLEDYRAWARTRVDLLNHALEGVPQDRVRYHICWGSFNAPHVGDVPAKDIVDLILRVKAGTYLIEMANPRHEHEWRLWRDELPDDKVLAPGVISHATNVVEHPELVSERLVRLAEVLGPERVMASTDCGFAQGPFTARVHASIQWAKLSALADGAVLASRQLAGAAE
jgi:5-methyltetrahydropteroyltriglutamate--homocysteine methyltransferase